MCRSLPKSLKESWDFLVWTLKVVRFRLLHFFSRSLPAPPQAPWASCMASALHNGPDSRGKSFLIFRDKLNDLLWESRVDCFHLSVLEWEGCALWGFWAFFLWITTGYLLLYCWSVLYSLCLVFKSRTHALWCFCHSGYHSLQRYS